MLASLSFALLATAVASTPCESLKSLSTPQAIIETAEFVQAGPFVPAAAAGRGAAPAAPFALAFWQTPSLTDLLWFIAAGLCGTLGHICQQRGYQLADITLLQPIGFLSLIWNTLLGYFLFFQQPDFWTFVGAAVIFGSAMYISHREAVRRAKVKTADSQAGPEA